MCSKINLLGFIDQPAIKYFRFGSPQVMAFKELKILCYAGWKTETLRKKKWTISFVAETLAILLVLHRQTEKGKEQWENELAAQSALAKLSPAVPYACTHQLCDCSRRRRLTLQMLFNMWKTWRMMSL
jgi:hypothetical protein